MGGIERLVRVLVKDQKTLLAASVRVGVGDHPRAVSSYDFSGLEAGVA